MNAGGERDARYWVEREAERAEATRDECLKRLVAAGILEQQQQRTLFVFKSEHYPAIDPTQEREVRRRIMDVLLSEDIPDPRDIVIIGIADATGIFKNMLSSRELERVADRIEQVRRLDLIGQAMTQAIRDIEVSIGDGRAAAPVLGSKEYSTVRAGPSRGACSFSWDGPKPCESEQNAGGPQQFRRKGELVRCILVLA